MNHEMLAVLEYMERERGVDRETVLQAIENAILTSARRAVGPAKDLRIAIDRKTYDIRALAQVAVVERVENPHDEVTLTRARAVKPDARIGDIIELEVTPKNMGRIAAQTAKQTIMSKIRQAERSRVYDEYKERPLEIVSGMVRRFERGDVIVDLGRAEALLPAKERVPTEEYQVGDRVRAIILRVQNDSQGPEIILSRGASEFVRKLFELEVAEVADGTVQIKALSREPGFRTKLAVHSNDDKVDPVGACVGMRGIRVKNVVRELSGEKIDIVRWSPDIATMVTNALAPAKLQQVLVDEATHRVTVIVDAEQLSLAIGRKGQNARLTAKMTGWKVDVIREEADVDFESKLEQAKARLAAVPGIGPGTAAVLVRGGFLSIEGILAGEVDDLAELDGLDRAQAEAIHAAALAAGAPRVDGE